MLIEAVTQPIRYTWPQGELRLEPGKPIEVPDDRGQKVLAKCGGKVRKVSPDWLAAWEELARLTYGLQPEDPRFKPTLTEQLDDRRFVGYRLEVWPIDARRCGDVKRLLEIQIVVASEVRVDLSDRHHTVPGAPRVEVFRNRLGEHDQLPGRPVEVVRKFVAIILGRALSKCTIGRDERQCN